MISLNMTVRGFTLFFLIDIEDINSMSLYCSPSHEAKLTVIIILLTASSSRYSWELVSNNIIPIQIQYFY